MLLGVLVVALVAPLVTYRHRDALMLLARPRGISVAWIIGTYLDQPRHRTWPAREARTLWQGLPAKGTP
jgi:hypothetical protein